MAYDASKLVNANKNTKIAIESNKILDIKDNFATKEKQKRNDYVEREIQSILNQLKKEGADQQVQKEIYFENAGELETVFKNGNAKMDFIGVRHELEQNTFELGKYWLGAFALEQKAEKIYPFGARILEYAERPITKEIARIAYIVGVVGTNYLCERKEWNPPKQAYDITRYYADEKFAEIKDKKIDAIYEPTISENEHVDGVVIYDYYDFQSNLQFARQKIADYAKFSHDLIESTDIFQPHIILRSEISGKDDNAVENMIRNDRVGKFKSRASQVDLPIDIYNPQSPIPQFLEAMRFVESEIYKRAIASAFTDTGKQAQTNDLEVAKKTEKALNSAEYKKSRREVQFTHFFRIIARMLGQELTDDFRVLFDQAQMTETTQKVAGDGEPIVDGQTIIENEQSTPKVVS